jgi:hypothetical protein
MGPTPEYDQYGYNPNHYDYRSNGFPPSQQDYDYSRPNQDYDSQSHEPPKEDYDSVRQRSFDVWAKWRANMNDSILSDFVGGEVRPIMPLTAALQDEGGNGETSQYDPNMLMNYSVCTNNVTDLESDAFLKFGIPRAKLNMTNLNYRHLFSADGERHVRVATENGKENMYIVRMQSKEPDYGMTPNRPMSPLR